MAAWRATLAALASYAIDFDSISEAEGARYLAVDFVEWLKLEVGGNDASRGEERTGHRAKSGPRANGTASSMPDELSA
jgi:hypothetical protein